MSKVLLYPSWGIKILPIRCWSGRSSIRRVGRGWNHRRSHWGDGQPPQSGGHDVREHNGPRAALLPFGQVGWLETHDTIPHLKVSWSRIHTPGASAATLSVAHSCLLWISWHPVLIVWYLCNLNCWDHKAKNSYCWDMCHCTLLQHITQVFVLL